MAKFRISETDELLAEYCHTVSSPRRNLLIRILGQGQRSVSELVELTGFTVSNISQHLKILRDKRIVSVRRSRGRATYRLTQPALLEVLMSMRQLFLTQIEPQPRPALEQNDE